MKKIIVSMFVLLLLLGGSVNAQKRKTVKKEDPTTIAFKEKAKLQTDKITAALVLTQDQSDKVFAVILETIKQKDSVITKNAGSDATTLMGAITPINDARDVKIKAILTPEQALQYDAKKTELTSMAPATPAIVH
jgi:hypothetical protein